LYVVAKMIFSSLMLMKIKSMNLQTKQGIIYQEVKEALFDSLRRG
jgi:hypothetical protein